MIRQQGSGFRIMGGQDRGFAGYSPVQQELAHTLPVFQIWPRGCLEPERTRIWYCPARPPCSCCSGCKAVQTCSSCTSSQTNSTCYARWRVVQSFLLGMAFTVG